jgi:hypothetical protein
MIDKINRSFCSRQLENKMEIDQRHRKPIEKFSQIPIVHSTLANAGDYYSKVKNSNFALRTSFKLAEISFGVFAFASKPIQGVLKKPSKKSNANTK